MKMLDVVDEGSWLSWRGDNELDPVHDGSRVGVVTRACPYPLDYVAVVPGLWHSVSRLHHMTRRHVKLFAAILLSLRQLGTFNNSFQVRLISFTTKEPC